MLGLKGIDNALCFFGGLRCHRGETLHLWKVPHPSTTFLLECSILHNFEVPEGRLEGAKCEK